MPGLSSPRSRPLLIVTILTLALTALSLGTNRAFMMSPGPDPVAPWLAGITVNTTVDEDNTGANCSLREAIVAANTDAAFGGCTAGSGSDTITLSATGTVTLGSALPNLSTSMQISGPGESLLKVSGNNSVRVFNVTVANPETVTLSGLRISDGNAGGNRGGGINNNSSGTINVTNCTIIGNSAQDPSGGGGGGISNVSTGIINVTDSSLIGNSSSFGGGIFNQNGGTINVTNSTISGNQGVSNGGGIFNQSGGAINVTNSTISENGGGFGGGIFNQSGGNINLTNSTISFNNSVTAGGVGTQGFGTITITNSTISKNSADNGGGISGSGTEVRLRNSIVALNTAHHFFPDLSGAMTSLGHNLIGKNDGSTGFTAGTTNANGDLVGTISSPIDPLLGNFNNYGGPTQTMPLLLGSPAIDAGDNCVVNNSCSPSLPSILATDQRGVGFDRSLDGNGDGTATVDIGAFEAIEVQGILVTNTADSGAGSLRQAIIDANSNGDANAINFQAGLTGTINLASPLDTLFTSMWINGPGANQLTVARSADPATPQFRVFRVANGLSTVRVQIGGITISNGLDASGGGIFTSGLAALTVKNCVITGNAANSSGGGVRNEARLTLTVVGSTISGNTAGSDGGGIVNGGIGSSATIINSTVSGNQAARGGGIYDVGFGITTLHLTNCTITNNTATNQSSASGLHTGDQSNQPWNPTVGNTIVAGNLGPGPDVVGFFTSRGNNLVKSDGSNGFTNGSNGDQVGLAVNPRLGPLANNGGPTQTHALLVGSPALDSGSNSLSDLAGLTTDQRGPGFTRKADGPDADTTPTVDIRAVEARASVEDLTDKSTPVGTPLSFSFNVGDSGLITSVTALSANGTLLPNLPANINVTGSGSTRTLNLTPAANQSGTSLITVTVTSDSESMSDTFTLNVNTGNGAPSFTKGPDQTVVEDSGAQSVANWATAISGPGNESGQTLTFLIQNNTNPGLFSAGPAISPTGTLTYTPAANANGSATITIALMHNGGGTDTSASQTFVITVTEDNDAPAAVNDTLTPIVEDQGPRAIPFADLTGNDSKGAANESGQTLTIISADSAVGGTLSLVAGFVVFTPEENYNGPASFDYTAQDNGTTNGVADPKTSGPAHVTFNITGVNDAPTAVNDTLASVAEDSGERTIAFADLTGNDSKGPADESGQTLLVQTVSNPVGVTVSIVAETVRVTPLPDFNGPGSFQYTVRDNGTTSGFSDEKSSVPATAQFTLTEVNDTPTAVNDTLGSVAEDSGPRTIMFADLTVNDSKGPANESGQILTVKTVGNPVGGTVSIVAGKVEFTPTADFNGAASFTYTVEDNGTPNGVADSKTSGIATVSFNITAVADTPAVTSAATKANTQTTSALIISRNPSDGAEVSHFKITGITGGSLFKNDGTTPIGNGDFITFAEGNAGLKFTPGTVNGSFTVQASTSATDAGLGGGTATATITINPLGGVLRFSSGNYSIAEGAGSRTITVERTGDTSRAATVDYASSDHSNPPDFIPCNSPGPGFASSRCDFTTATGTLRFAAGETSRTFNLLISQDNYVEGPETLELTLSNPTGEAVFGVPQTAILSITDDATEPAANPIDTSSEFVRSQYHDFLNREPDAPGFAFWTDNIEKCTDPARRPAGLTVEECVDKQRESTAVAFFSAPEFQITGGFVYHLYKGSLTGAPNYDAGSPGSSPGRFPTALEFLRDVSQVSEGIVVNNQISGPVIEANRDRLAAEFVQRPEFLAKYGTLNNPQYVLELFNTTGIPATAAEKQSLVEGLNNATETRASVLRKVVDGTVVINEGNVQFTTPYGQAFVNQENRRVFVFMEYVGYLRRNPDAAGFVFWLAKLNTHDGDPFAAEMVRAFILSPEYRNRFGQP
jgi:CSLREA domain-containing protein